MPQRHQNSQFQSALRPGSACLALLGLLSLGTVGARAADSALTLLSHAGFAQAGAGFTHPGGPVPVGESKLAQAAAPAPASDAALCALPDELLQVTVGGQTRGDFLIKITPSGVLLEQQALQASEIRYGRQTVTCDGVAYLLLTPEVKPNYDPAAQTLSLTPVLDLLPGNTLDFRGAKALTPAPTQPAYGADGGLRVNANSGGTFSAQTYVGGAYFGGALSGYAGVSASASSSNTAAAGRTTTGTFGVRAVVHYDVSTDWGVSAAYRVDAATVGGLGYGVGSFSGLSVNTRGGLQRELAKVELDLPLEANVVVRVGERTLRSFRAAPGKLVLLNIPLENVVGTVEVNVSDSTGTRSFSSPYSFGGGTLQPGGYVATARAGYLGDPFSGTAQRTADLNLRVGLPRNWSLQGAARLLEGEYGASVQARHSGAAEALGFGATVSGTLTPESTGTGSTGTGSTGTGSTGTTGGTGTRLIPDVRLNADYSRQIGNLGLSATVAVPLLKPSAAQVGAALGYQSGRWSSSFSGGYDFGARSINAALGAGYTFDDQRQLTAGITGGYNLQDKLWNAGLTASYTASNRQQYNAYVTGTPGRVTVGIGLRYTPDDKLAIDAGANVSAPVGTPSTATPEAASYGGTLAASYLLAPNQTVRASTDFRSLNASYEDSRRVYASAGASLTRTTAGVDVSGSAELRGAVTFLGGKAVLGQGLGQRAVVVRTGTPGIPLLLNGSRVAVTGADGEALLTGLPEGSISQVAVDLDALPFNITARDASADVSLAQSGVYVLDWTHNFDVSRWVQLFWGPAEHSVYGVFEVGGQKYTLDDQGYVLIPDTRGAQRGTLSADDGSRSCQLDIPASGEKAVCPVQPVQNTVGTAPTALPEVVAQPPAPGPDGVQKP
jgi:outer membrane usher protein